MQARAVSLIFGLALIIGIPVLANAKSFTQSTTYWSDCKLTYQYTSHGTIPEDDLFSVGDVMVGHYGMYGKGELNADIVRRNGKNVPIPAESISEAEVAVGMLYMNTRISAYRDFKIQSALINCSPAAVKRIRVEVEQAEAEKRAEEEQAAAEKRKKEEERASKIAEAIEQLRGSDPALAGAGYMTLMNTPSEDGDQVLVEYLRGRLRDVAPSQKANIVQAFDQLGARAAAALPDVLPYVQDLGSPAQGFAISFVQQIRDPQAIDALRYAVVEAPLLPEDSYQQSAIANEAQINGENARTAIKVILGEEKGEAMIQQLKAEIQARRSGQASAEQARLAQEAQARVSSLIHALETGDQETKRKVVYELGGGVTSAGQRPLRPDEIKAAIPALGQELESGNPDEFYRANIAAALGKTGDESAVPYLKNALASERSPTAQSEIENALRQILGARADQAIAEAKRGESSSGDGSKRKKINPGELLKKGLKGFGF